MDFMDNLTKYLFRRIKSRLSRNDISRICEEHANELRVMKPLAEGFAHLYKVDSSEDWYRVWSEQFSTIIGRIAEGNSREQQSYLCRVEILSATESSELNQFLLDIKDTELRKELIGIFYPEYENLDEWLKWAFFIKAYTFSLMSVCTLNCLYGQQLAGYLSEDAFSNLNTVICRLHTRVLCYTYITDAMKEFGEPYVQAISGTYLNNHSSEILKEIEALQSDFKNWICSGQVKGTDFYRSRLLNLIDEYGDAQEIGKEKLFSLMSEQRVE